METMKKEWGKPLTDVQEFTPQEFIAACDPDEIYRIYNFWCDASLGGYEYYAVYPDNGDGVYSNADQRRSYFHPCGETHTARVNVGAGETAEDVFPVGWLRPATRHWVPSLMGGHWEYEVVPNSAATKVWLWYGLQSDNTHATMNLKFDEYTEHNPS